MNKEEMAVVISNIHTLFEIKQLLYPGVPEVCQAGVSVKDNEALLARIRRDYGKKWYQFWK